MSNQKYHKAKTGRSVNDFEWHEIKSVYTRQKSDGKTSWKKIPYRYCGECEDIFNEDKLLMTAKPGTNKS
jgi:hypothetical protein